MSIVAWIILGLFAGFIASNIVSGSGKGVLVDLILGVVGALVGGAVFNYFGRLGITGFDLRSLFVAVIGAVIVLAIQRAVTRRPSRASP